eukprot:SAG11_NODE_972_length_6340_cov_3.043423_8_plen_83_part_00
MMDALKLLTAMASLALASAGTLVDHPIASDTVTYLDGADWKVTATEPNADAAEAATALWTIAGTVPGDLLTGECASTIASAT